MHNFKYNIGDIVKSNFCNNLKVVNHRYYDEGIGENRYNLKDLYGETDCAHLERSINKPETIKRIDMIMLQENPSEILGSIFGRYCENSKCAIEIKSFLEQEIDNDINNLMVFKNDNEEINNQKENKNTEELNDFMKEYKKIITDLSELCIKKNKDYGSSVVDTYDKFGDVSYLVRITDKYNRILSVFKNKGEHEVEDETIIDTVLDMANYCLLWVANEQMVEKCK